MGFEPTEPAKVQRFSRPPDSTTLAPHRISNLPDFRNAGKLAATPTGAVHDTIAGGSQSWPVLGAGFKPAVRYFVSRVGSTPTGFRQFSLSEQKRGSLSLLRASMSESIPSSDSAGANGVSAGSATRESFGEFVSGLLVFDVEFQASLLYLCASPDLV